MKKYAEELGSQEIARRILVCEQAQLKVLRLAENHGQEDCWSSEKMSKQLAWWHNQQLEYEALLNELRA